LTEQATRVSVVICAYTEKRWDDLVSAVAALEAQTRPAEEVIVVIDHNDDLFNRAQAEISGITLLIKNTNPRGLSGARNTGIAQATGDILVFIDEDAAAVPTWLENLLAPFADPTVMGVGGKITPLWLDGEPSWFPNEFNWVVGCTYRGTPVNTAPVRNLIGCNMSFRREVFDEVGTFRDGIGRIGTLPVGCEETELCIRARQHWTQREFIYEPSAEVHHRVPGSRGTWAYFRSRCYAEGISKALISEFVGTEDSLSSERTYTLQTLPSGVLFGLRDTLRGDFSGLLRSVAIVTGLGTTGIGYLAGKWQNRRRHNTPSPTLTVTPK